MLETGDERVATERQSERDEPGAQRAKLLGIGCHDKPQVLVVQGTFATPQRLVLVCDNGDGCRNSES